MNRFLLVWNLVLTVLIIALVIGGCASLDPGYASLTAEVEQNRALIQQLLNQANENRQLIATNQAAVTQNTLNIASLQQALAVTQSSIEQWVQEYVQQALQQR
jgi:uncharacterized protein HemX